ncbi:crotonase/enoyl-CoA hydratase family protein [Allobranchiibius sp. CTAmp26]|uniref:crotonase/enoyl-CoA hydratase family protein n=1 Tax=Allobranchiibius sp. CTAmp26 TaxID=2815214 RepID=UPI001AA1C9CA|nr:crotonase/enoyl-CoA hydratase family protein [Allobranchiibius sp. CTAmp26]MBO1754027.1 crotonase/enoyl-CoA hydratase family protein [Allobranchiibius sp. CTAmp26]
MAVTCNVADGIADVRLARPDKLNALTLPMLEGLIDAAHALRSDTSVRAVVISGEGESFCAGLDFAEAFGQAGAVAKAVVPRPWRGTNTFQEACWVWRRLPVPVIAAVHGHCYGGGVQIALGADFRITAPDAKWSVLEGKWGLIPDMSGIRSLAQLVGIEQAKRLTMTAQVFSGERAHEIGLVGAVGADPYAEAQILAGELATRSPDALAAAKRLFETRWNAGPRRTFARERIEQVRLMAGRNFKIARTAAFARETPAYLPRGR